MTPATRARARGASRSFTLRMALRTNGPLATKRISNRHSCRLETRLNPCAPMKPPLLIVTKSPPFCAQIPTTIKRISNRNIPLLESSQPPAKTMTSKSLR